MRTLCGEGREGNLDIGECTARRVLSAMGVSSSGQGWAFKASTAGSDVRKHLEAVELVPSPPGMPSFLYVSVTLEYEQSNASAASTLAIP